MSSNHDVTEHLEVVGRTTVQGAVRRGATIRSGGHLFLQGAFLGPAVLEEGAVLTVQGTFHGDSLTNDGTVILHGVVNLELTSDVGRLAIGVGSLIMREGRPFRLTSTGDLIEVKNDVRAGDLTISTEQVCFFDATVDRFVPLGLQLRSDQ